MATRPDKFYTKERKYNIELVLYAVLNLLAWPAIWGNLT